MKSRYLLLAGLLAVSSAAQAGTIVCSGKVAALSYHSPDKMMVRLEGMNTAVFFCSPDKLWSVPGTPYTTGPETCKTMYSTFLSAQMAGKRIESLYLDGDGTPATCDSFPNWASYNVRHYSLVP